MWYNSIDEKITTTEKHYTPKKLKMPIEKGFFITLIIFVIIYELVMYMYSLKLKRLSIKSITSE